MNKAGKAAGFAYNFAVIVATGGASAEVSGAIGAARTVEGGIKVIATGRAATGAVAAMAAHYLTIATMLNNMRLAANSPQADKGITCKTEGRYEFPDKKAPSNEPYVGQSKNVEKRLKTHEKNGRLDPGTEKVKEVKGGKTAREISEHKRIQEITGGEPAKTSSKVSNKKDPIGPKRQNLLEK